MTSEKQPESHLGEHVDHVALSQSKTELQHEEHGPHDLHSTLGHHESPEWKSSERRVVRKLDMTLLPTVWVLYMFNYLDRNNIA